MQMKKRIYVSFITLLLSNAIVSGQNQKPSVTIKDFGFINDKIEIQYQMNGYNPNDKYVVWLEGITDAGHTYKARNVSGDVNFVKPNQQLKLDWHTQKDSLLIDDQLRIKLFAYKRPQLNLRKALLYSTAFPGLAYKHVEAKNKWYLGFLGYAGIGSAIYFNALANENYTKYLNEKNKSKADTYFKDSKKYSNFSYAGLGVGAAMWAINYYFIPKAFAKSKKKTPADYQLNHNRNNLLVTETPSKFISTRGLPPNLFAELSFKDANNNGILEANENAEVILTIINQGKGDAYNLNIFVIDDNVDKGLKIGSNIVVPIIKSNETKKISIPISSDTRLKTALHKLKIVVSEKYGFDMDPAYLVLQTFEYQTAKLNFAGLEIFDAGEWTAPIVEDGLLQAGEQVRVKIAVQNIGQGVAEKVNFIIETKDPNIYLRENYGNLGNIKPGEVKEFYFLLNPNKRVVNTSDLPLYLTVKEENNYGNLFMYQLPIKLEQKPPQTNIITVQSDIESLVKNIARFEYSSKKFTSANSTLINVKSVLPSKTKRPDAYAVILGVNKYETLANAPYADNDALLMKDYFEKVLGIPQGNIIMLTNNEVTLTKMKKIFNANYGDLQKVITKDKSEIFVFFSGHGIPDKSGNNTYLMPYDGIKEDLENFAYSTTRLYDDLVALAAKKVTVILDACFSGSSRKSEKIGEENLIAQKGIRIIMKKPWINNPDFVMIHSSTGEETSLGLDASETGLFTYYFCAALQGNADENSDKKITFGEIKKYVTEKVNEHSKKISGTQNPEFKGDENLILVEY